MKLSSSRRDRGFTLIEVLLVLVILVVLASLAVVAYGPIQRRYKVNAAKAQIGLFKTALETYQVTVESYPTTQEGLQSLRYRPADAQEGSKWDGPYLDTEVPLDPWGHQYQYACPGQKNQDSFDVWTISPDGQEIGNWNEQVQR
jgi:general secretion pathway protein G